MILTAVLVSSASAHVLRRELQLIRTVVAPFKEIVASELGAKLAKQYRT
jgi:hypothetical protein